MIRYAEVFLLSPRFQNKTAVEQKFLSSLVIWWEFLNVTTNNEDTPANVACNKQYQLCFPCPPNLLPSFPEEGVYLSVDKVRSQTCLDKYLKYDAITWTFILTSLFPKLHIFSKLWTHGKQIKVFLKVFLINAKERTHNARIKLVKVWSVSLALTLPCFSNFSYSRWSFICQHKHHIPISEQKLEHKINNDKKVSNQVEKLHESDNYVIEHY